MPETRVGSAFASRGGRLGMGNLRKERRLHRRTRLALLRMPVSLVKGGGSVGKSELAAAESPERHQRKAAQGEAHRGRLRRPRGLEYFNVLPAKCSGDGRDRAREFVVSRTEIEVVERAAIGDQRVPQAIEIAGSQRAATASAGW